MHRPSYCLFLFSARRAQQSARAFHWARSDVQSRVSCTTRDTYLEEVSGSGAGKRKRPSVGVLRPSNHDMLMIPPDIDTAEATVRFCCDGRGCALLYVVWEVHGK